MKISTIVATAALAVLACDSVRPGGSRFELVGAGGESLPAFLRQEGGCVHRLYGSTVQFDGEGGYTSTYDIRIVCADSTGKVPNVGTRGRFTVRDDTAFFIDSSGRPTGVGRLTADSLIVQGSLHRLSYARR